MTNRHLLIGLIVASAVDLGVWLYRTSAQREMSRTLNERIERIVKERCP